MADSFLKIIDEAMRGLVFIRFQTELGLTDITKDAVLHPRETALRIISEKRGRDVLEFFNIWRMRTEMPWDRHRSPLARRGLMLAFTDGLQKKDIRTPKAMPVNLEYGVWFWSQNLDKLNAVTEKYIFWQHQNPNLELVYGGVYPMEMDLHFGPVDDESPVPNMFDNGLYFVKKVPIFVDGWILTDFLLKAIHKIVITLYSDETPPNEDILLQQLVMELFTPPP